MWWINARAFGDLWSFWELAAVFRNVFMSWCLCASHEDTHACGMLHSPAVVSHWVGSLCTNKIKKKGTNILTTDDFQYINGHVRTCFMRKELHWAQYTILIQYFYYVFISTVNRRMCFCYPRLNLLCRAYRLLQLVRPCGIRKWCSNLPKLV